MSAHWGSAAKEAAGKAGRVWRIAILIIAVAIVLVAISPRLTIRIGGSTYEVQRIVDP